MTELREALAALRRDVDRAFAGEETSGGTRPGRVRLKLGLEWVTGRESGGHGFWRPAAVDSCHTIELEWQPVGGGGEAVVEVAEATALANLETALPEQLDAAFGRPGFDSAARATVFREVVAEVGAERMQQVLDAVCLGARLDDAAGERARHALTRLLERGPSGVAGGCAALKRVFETHGFDAVLREVAARWHYGTGHDLGSAG